jgi:hypothetical protein
MCDVATVLTTRYVLVDDIDKVGRSQVGSGPMGSHGPAPSLSRSEVVSLAICAQWAHFESERAFYR